MPDVIRLEVLDAPTGKGRPRFNRSSGRAYTPTKTANAEARIRHAWDEAGRPTIAGDTPITAYIVLWVERPADHHKRDGSLTAKGQRETLPYRRKPDVDNAAKLVLDALEKYAYPRDVAICDLTVRRFWCVNDDPPRVEIHLWNTNPEGDAA